MPFSRKTYGSFNFLSRIDSDKRYFDEVQISWREKPFSDRYAGEVLELLSRSNVKITGVSGV